MFSSRQCSLLTSIDTNDIHIMPTMSKSLVFPSSRSKTMLRQDHEDDGDGRHNSGLVTQRSRDRSGNELKEDNINIKCSAVVIMTKKKHEIKVVQVPS